MSKPKPSRAEQLRRHREIFEYARAHGLTLLEAESAMARDQWRAAQDRLAAVRRCGRTADPQAPIATEAPARPAPSDAPWMMRD